MRSRRGRGLEAALETFLWAVQGRDLDASEVPGAAPLVPFAVMLSAHFLRAARGILAMTTARGVPI